jgi:hypothetical protein
VSQQRLSLRPRPLRLPPVALDLLGLELLQRPHRVLVLGAHRVFPPLLLRGTPPVDFDGALDGLADGPGAFRKSPCF